MQNYSSPTPAPRPARTPTGARPAPARRTPPEQRNPRQTPPKRRGSRWFRAIIMVLATVGLCFFFAIFILQSANDLFGLNQDNMEIEVVVPEKPTVATVAELLAEKGVIEKTLTFRLYADLKTKDKDFLGGTYVFNSNMGYDELILELQNGNIKREIVKLTFIEGMTLYEYAKQLEDAKICKADEFIQTLQSGTFDYEFLDMIPTDANRFRRLEGYLFPDTYEFYENDNVNRVVNKFLSNFDNRVTDSMMNQMQNLNLTLDQAITLASIIEKEAGDPVEMRLVSSVFHNRLSMSETYPQLQSDVTIHYVEKFIKPFLDYQNTEMYDAYNTYVSKGLPVAPICNPSLSAIEAALNPEETKYLFFVTDSEGTYYYSSTPQEHYAKVAAARKVGEGKIHGIDTE